MPASPEATLAATALQPGKSGADLLHDPALNKGTAFTYEERRRFGLLGLLPPRVSTMDQQVERVLGNVRRKSNDLDKYIELMALLDRNETLFYRVVIDHIEELMPIIYTPVVGAACQLYAHIFRRSRGVFITPKERGNVAELLRNWPRDDVRVIVVTDGERILGLGDLGANGMGIPVGKLALYTACAGVAPWQTLPVTLDVGTENAALREDPLYLGLAQPRVRGAEYDALVDEFMSAARARFPSAMIQFEDFANRNAFRLLERYRDQACVFNDDIQGTASVTLAGLLAAARLGGRKLSEQTLLFHGAGEAAIGIADLVVAAMRSEGLPEAEAKARCWFMDSKGLVQDGRTDLEAHKRPYARPHRPIVSLVDAVRELRPTALIGVSAQPGQFTRAVVEAMAAANDRPIVFALSNPTSRAECTAEQAYGWSGGRAIFASGSPFPEVSFGGRRYVPGQANNAYVFPGIGLGVTASGATRVTEEMFLEAARALASLVTEEDLALGRLFPALTRLREASTEIAAAVAETAYRRGLAREPRRGTSREQAAACRYEPVYRPYV